MIEWSGMIASVIQVAQVFNFVSILAVNGDYAAGFPDCRHNFEEIVIIQSYRFLIGHVNLE